MRARIVHAVILLFPLGMTLFPGAQVGGLIDAQALDSGQPPEKNSTRDSDSYRLRIPVNEIELTFRAFNKNGAPLLQLAYSDLRLSDDGKQQKQFVMLESFRDLPVRAGFIVDSSTSMAGHIKAARAIIQLYASQLFRKGTDQGFLMEFDSIAVLHHDWTANPTDLFANAKSMARQPPGRLALTSLYDSVYTACHDRWSQDHGSMTGNFILLFSDGVDDDSRSYLSDAVDMCQRKRVTIYIITFDRKSPFSSGQRNLAELASETGGRVYFAPTNDELLQDLHAIDTEQRNQFRLVYRPSAFKADGKFHRVKLQCNIRGAEIMTRSGYYQSLQP
jgi:Ca-activated chloride channel homolog